MPRPPANGGDWSSARDDGWGAATTVRGGSPRQPPRESARRAPAERSVRDDGWSSGPASRDQQRSNRANDRSNRANEKRTERSIRDLERQREAVSRPPERGVRAWLALLIVLIIAAIGGIIDTIGSIDVQGGFNVGIVVASVIGILIVKRSNMFPVVIAPPIVYTLGAAFQYLIKASGGNATKAKIDAAANYLVYGFPAIAIATAAVLIIAGARLILRK